MCWKNGTFEHNFLVTEAGINAPNWNVPYCAEMYTGFHPHWNDSGNKVGNLG